jgi:plastocyanin
MRSSLKYLPLAAVLACGGSDSTGINTGGGGNTPAPATASVEMKTNQFSPTSVRVAKGGTINWSNADGYAHNVTFPTGSGLTDIAAFTTGVKSATMPPSPATITYQCTIHPGMNGTITVE